MWRAQPLGQATLLGLLPERVGGSRACAHATHPANGSVGVRVPVLLLLLGARAGAGAPLRPARLSPKAQRTGGARIRGLRPGVGLRPLLLLHGGRGRARALRHLLAAAPSLAVDLGHRRDLAVLYDPNITRKVVHARGHKIPQKVVLQGVPHREFVHRGVRHAHIPSPLLTPAACLLHQVQVDVSLCHK